MIKKLKEIWSELGRSIYVGERYRNNMRGLAIGASMIVIVNLITGCMKLRKGYTMGALSSLILILFFSVLLSGVFALLLLVLTGIRGRPAGKRRFPFLPFAAIPVFCFLLAPYF